MTNEQSPITPPPELFAQWEDDILDSQDNVDYVLDCAWRNGFQAGADQELEAIFKMVGQQSLPEEDRYLDGLTVASIRAARRPKPPSLRKQAYDALDTYIYGEPDPKDKERTYNAIRQALEALPND